ncbi:putative formate transporter 1 [Trueperella bernardiae]|uniref:Putative formate transporter 1 n=1 Tax=Trueperella bernardiae TaxID=59561 RepID=A0A0W1KJF4_9ACTO|nr:formate transporter FocA [Trueperella bernardiae]KTF04148.1 putative formate transporter 1 [Trueperella bernardiae]
MVKQFAERKVTMSTLSRTADETAAYLAEQMYHKATAPARKSFALAVMAGFLIGLGFVFYTTTQMGAVHAEWYGLTKLVGGVSFSVGLILVILTGADLFTSTTMTLIPLTEHRIRAGQWAKHWGIVYLGNFTGALVLAALIVASGTYMQGEGAWGAVAMSAAMGKLSHSWGQAFVLGILCNMLVCLAIWASYTGKTTADKILAAFAPIALFVATGFEHSVANMFLIPMAIATSRMVGPEFWTSEGPVALGLDPSATGTLTVQSFLLDNLIPVTLGNIVGGGLMIGMFFWWTHAKAGSTSASRR